MKLTIPVFDFWDIGTRKQYESEIRQALAEKETLLREIHHRVKNNLQIVISLLSLQYDRPRNGNSKEIIQECRQRIFSMALLHDTLYQSQNLTHIGFKEYAESLLRELAHTYNVSHRIKYDMDISDVAMDITKTINCGLILNELVTNSIKYAFNDHQLGTVRIELQPTQNGLYKFMVQDNGRGIPHDVDLEHPTTLGLVLVRSLTEQMRGKMNISRQNGTTCTILVPSRNGFHAPTAR